MEKTNCPLSVVSTYEGRCELFGVRVLPSRYLCQMHQISPKSEAYRHYLVALQLMVAVYRCLKGSEARSKM
jgi:hypothetical protein